MRANLLLVIVAMLALASCTKDYVCTIEWYDGPTEDVFKGLDKDEAREVQKSCQALGGTWSMK